MPTKANKGQHKAGYGRALLAGTLLAAGLLAPAQAHDSLVSSNPQADSALSQAPQEIELTYSSDIMQVEGANQIRVTNSAGESVTEGEPEISGTTLTQDLTTSGSEDETYTVNWRVVSSDGHPIQGTFSYSVGQGKTDAPAEASASTSPEEGTSHNTDSIIAVEGLGTLPRILIAVLAALAIAGGAFVVLTKNKKK